MLRLSPLSLLLGLSALAACAEDQSPTQPGSDTNVQPTAPAVAALTSNSWTIKAAPPGFPFMNGASAGVMPDASGNPVVYLLGGGDNDGGWSTPVLTYRVATNTWGSPGSQPRVDVFNSNGVGRIGNLLYISGGENYAGGGFGIQGLFFAYDPAKNTLTQKATPPKLTAEGVTGVIGGKLYVLPAVCDGERYPNPTSCEFEDFRRLFRYNPATNAWVTKKQAPHFHRQGAGGVINGQFYVAGGRGNNVLDRYDPATDTWKTLAPIPVTGSTEQRAGHRVPGQAVRRLVPLQSEPGTAVGCLLVRPGHQRVDPEGEAHVPPLGHRGNHLEREAVPGRGRWGGRARGAEPGGAVYAVAGGQASRRAGERERHTSLLRCAVPAAPLASPSPSPPSRDTREQRRQEAGRG